MQLCGCWFCFVGVTRNNLTQSCVCVSGLTALYLISLLFLYIWAVRCRFAPRRFAHLHVSMFLCFPLITCLTSR